MSKKVVEIIPILKDRYSYLIINQKNTYLIDAGDYEDIFEFLKEKDIHLDYLLCTHHHSDHTDGILKLKKIFNCMVCGPHDIRIKNLDHFFEIDKNTYFNDIIEIIPTPGHTKSHLIYYLKLENKLFTGDLLFGAGCGKIFDGTYLEMFNSLQKIKKLPLQTNLYFGHEYTIKNLEFAYSIEPDNLKIRQRLDNARNKRAKNEFTTPSTLQEELDTNPFLRTNCEKLKDILNMSQVQELEIFTYLRQLKDKF
jgi:hydroxyacylglutathione hydrolase